MVASDDDKKKQAINEMFGDEDSDDDEPMRNSSAVVADASGLFGSDSESDEDTNRSRPLKSKSPVQRAATADASGLFGSDSEDDSDLDTKRLKVSGNSRVSTKSAGSSRDQHRSDEGDEYDSGEEIERTKEDDDFIDADDELADVLGEYDQETQRFDDERPMDDVRHGSSSGKGSSASYDYFDEMLKSLRTGRRRSKLNLTVQDMEQITQEVLYQMDKAYADDLVAIQEKRPALEKIKYVDKAISIMKKHQLQPMLLDFDLLGIIKKWLDPVPTNSSSSGILPNVGIRTKLLTMVSRMPVFKEHLKRSGFGKVVMTLWKHPQETRENKEICRELIERWSRTVFNKTLDFSQLRDFEAEKANDPSYRRQQQRSLPSSKSTSGSTRGSTGKNIFLTTQDNSLSASSSAERAALPQQLRFDFLQRPQPKIDVTNMQAPKKMDRDSRKGRLVKRMADIAKPGKKAKRAMNVSIEGR